VFPILPIAMENKDEKLIRSRNFTPSEINILVQLVEKRRQILECKKTGVITTKKKNATWEELAKEFNSLSGCLPRSAKVLRDKWANIKKTAVRNHSADKKYSRGTGGGPSKNKLETTADAVVMDILGERLTGMVSEYDSDQQQYAGITT
jgi:hypothetical protein